MIHKVRGNLLHADAEALVNTVNTVGVMGRGIALQISRTYPQILPQYEAACTSGALKPGTVLTADLRRLANPKYIINVPTKRHWKGNSKIEDIESGLEALANEIVRLGVTSVAVPPLGCGLGGLDWSRVYPRIEAALSRLPGVDVYVYEPAGAPEARSVVAGTKRPPMTTAPASLLGLMARYLAAQMDDSTTLLEIHKLMYFLQRAGEGLRLRFLKGKYGPWAKNLSHVLKRIEGHFIVGFGDGSEAPGKVIEVMPGAGSEAERVLSDHPKTMVRIDRVTQLLDGFETPFGMELLASVHWVACENPAASIDPEIAFSDVAAWNDRKRDLFSPDHVVAAWDRLKVSGWLPGDQ